MSSDCNRLRCCTLSRLCRDYIPFLYFSVSVCELINLSLFFEKLLRRFAHKAWLICVPKLPNYWRTLLSKWERAATIALSEIFNLVVSYPVWVSSYPNRWLIRTRPNIHSFKMPCAWAQVQVSSVAYDVSRVKRVLLVYTHDFLNNNN